MKYPLVILTIAFCLGIFFAHFIKLFYWLIIFLSVIFISLRFKKDLIADSLIFCLSFLLGAFLLKAHDNLPRCHILNYLYFSQQPYAVKGWVKSEPRLNLTQTTFIFATEAIKLSQRSYHCCGDILVRLSSKKKLRYGEALILRGNLYRPFYSKNYLSNQEIYLILSVKTELDMVVLGENKGFLLKRFALFLKEKIGKIFSRYTNAWAASILEAMVLGEKRNIPPAVTNLMMKTGTIHILVVSGFNVGIVASFILMFLKLARIQRQMRYCLTVILLLVYCLMTGASNPVVRATIMASIFVLAYLFKREANIYNSLSIAALFILGLNPRQLFDIGFQLSFLSVIAIVYLYPKISSFMRINQLKPTPLRYLASAATVSFSAWIGTIIPIVGYFKIFSPIAVLANIFIIPLATLVTLCGFSLAIISLILPALAPFFSATTELATALLLKTNAFLASLPGAYFYL